MQRTAGILLIFGVWQLTLLLAVCVGLLLPRSSAPVPTASAETFSQPHPKPAVEEPYPGSTVSARLHDTIQELKKERDHLSNTLLRLSLQQTLDRALSSGRSTSNVLRPHATAHVGDALVGTQPASREFLQGGSLGHLQVDRAAQHLGAHREQLRRALEDIWNWEALEDRLIDGLGDNLDAWEAIPGRREFSAMPLNRQRTPRSGSGLGGTSETLKQLETLLLLVRDIQHNASRNGFGPSRSGPYEAEHRDTEVRMNRLLKSVLLIGLIRTISEFDSTDTLIEGE